MLLSREQFQNEVYELKDQYRRDNAWVQKTCQWNHNLVMKIYINSAYNLYEAAARNVLQMVILGDTKIRSMPELLRNFGLLSAAGVQEKKESVLVKDLEAHRTQVAMGTQEGLAGRTKLLGAGSILSDKMWSPILNDALMLGAIEGWQGFYFGLNADEQAFWDSNGFSSNVADKISIFGKPVKSTRDREQANWLSFLRRNPEVLWRNGNPRVFARELLALKFFGYAPEFSKIQLAFSPGMRSRKGPPTFRLYTQSLRELGFFAKNKVKVLSAISEFLFEDKEALL